MAEMYPPVLVVPPASMPVSLDEARRQLRVDHQDDDVVIERLIMAATSYLEGPTGILGNLVLVDQTWSRRFDGFDQAFCLLLRNAHDVVSMTYVDVNGTQQIIDQSEYFLRQTRGLPTVVSRSGSWEPHASLHDGTGVEITFVAGYGEADKVPQALRHAILMLVAHWYENREAVDGSVSGTAGNTDALPLGFHDLVAPFKATYLTGAEQR